jgi:gamma-tubulin complex component 2
VLITRRSMKHFFFLDQSDFLTNFLDLASSELRKPARGASIVKLQSLLDLAIRNPASSSSADPYKDDLKVTMQSQGLYEWLLKIVSRTGGMNEDGELDFAAEQQEDDAARRPGERERVLLGWLRSEPRCFEEITDYCCSCRCTRP